MPDQLTAAFQQYVARIQNPTVPQNQYGDQFVNVVIQEDFHAPGVFSDWEGGGKMAPTESKPGIPESSAAMSVTRCG